VLYESTVVGDRCIIHAGAVIGAYGFGYVSSPQGHVLGEQLGHVEIGDDVEIGACATIDRGTWGATRIGNGTKMDNQVQIGHNCQIGPHNLLCSQVGIAGSCRTGSFVVMAGQVGIADHINISDHSVLCAKAGVMEDLEGGQTWLGAPAKPIREQMQIFATLPRLPEIRRELRNLARQVEAMKAPKTTLEFPGQDAGKAA
jgi:UDP-3-O-[3-hydroxymyristoyl] glucosamine N-acyltransferase